MVFGVVWCGVVSYGGKVWCGVVWRGIEWRSTVGAEWYGAVLVAILTSRLAAHANPGCPRRKFDRKHMSGKDGIPSPAEW